MFLLSHNMLTQIPALYSRSINPYMILWSSFYTSDREVYRCYVEGMFIQYVFEMRFFEC